MGLREEKKQQTRQEIEAAAFVLFEEVGYSNARTADIARRANVSESTLFRYFTTKEEIALAPFRRRCDILIERVLERPMTETPMEVSLALSNGPELLDLVPSMGRRAEWMVLTEAPELLPQLLATIYEVELKVANHFEERLGPGSAMEAMITASAVGGVLQAMLLMWTFDPVDFDPFEATRTGIQSLKDGLR